MFPTGRSKFKVGDLEKRYLRQFLKCAVLLSSTIFLSPPAVSQTNGNAGGGLGSPNNAANQKAPVTGTVELATNSAELHNIKVTLTASSGEPVAEVFTDSRGNFAFAAVPAGNYVVSIEAEGYEPFRETVIVLGRPGPRVYAMLKVSKDGRAVLPGNAVSTRELALPQRAQEALRKGLDALYAKRDPKGSLVFFGQVVLLAPDFYEAYYDQGVAYMKLDQKTEAEAALRKSIEVSKESFAEAYLTLASMDLDANHFSEAEPLVRKGLAIQPDSWRGHYELARALFGEGLPVDAEQSANECRRLQPNFPRLYILLANIQLRLGRNESVIRNLDIYLKLEPDGPYSAQAKALKEKTEKSLGRAAAPLGPGS